MVRNNKVRVRGEVKVIIIFFMIFMFDYILFLIVGVSSECC